MNFGKLDNIEAVNFHLPPDAFFNQQLFASLPDAENPLHFYLGCTGWSMKEWVGKVYPEDAKSKDYLHYYSRQFNTIELNTTHYRIPDFKTVEKWYREAADDFKFCPKIPQTISHSKDLGLGNGQVHQFCEAIQELKEKLGPCFIQLPPYFGADRLPLLEHFLAKFPSHIPLAVEVRHESWFTRPNLVDGWLARLHAQGCLTVITDVAGRRDVLHMGLAGNTAVIRFVGNDLHPSDYTRIDDWVSRLLAWHREGLQHVYFFTHEPDNLKAPELAAHLWEKLTGHRQVLTRGPKLLQPPGKQMQLF